jgi:hypothetical protein
MFDESKILGNNLKLLTVSSSEVKEDEITKWKYTAEYYGYDYEILGRKKKWKGWSFRTQLYLNYILKHPEYEVFCLVDCTDLFFCAPVEELYEKFCQYQKDIIIGVENTFFYRNSSKEKTTKYPHKLVQRVFDNVKSRYRYPNGGFLIGKRKAIIHLLKENLAAEDDQAGYMNLCYENKVHLYRDLKTELCGNIPFVKEGDESIYWEYDPINNRFYNTETKGRPCILHFPGKNYSIMNRFYEMLFF